MCLFALLTLNEINKTVLNSGFHQTLFEKHDIYSHTQTVISSSIKEFSYSLKAYAPQSSQQQEHIFSLLDKTVTHEMIKTNIDSIREGLFKYFKGDIKVLPDILLNVNNDNFQYEQQNPSALSLPKINKINLSAILMYINRNDIYDSLSILKLVYYLTHWLPGMLFLIIIILLLAGIIILQDFKKIRKWLGISIMFCGTLNLSAGIIIALYVNNKMPGSIYPVLILLPFRNNVVMSYIYECISPIYRFLAVSGTILIFLGLGFLFIHLSLYSIYSNSSINNYIKKRHIKLNAFIKSIIIFIITATIFLMTNYIYNFKKDFQSNDFAVTIAKIKKPNTVTQVISAKDQTIYSLQVKCVDSKTSKTIENIQIRVSGTSNAKRKFFNNLGTTDITGSTKFSLDKGTFHLSFVSGSIPADYKIPSSFFFDLKNAGTTIITISLDPLEDLKYGIAEIEVLDKNNEPVPGLQLKIEGTVSAPGNPDRLLSYTNSVGIAVFKTNEGKYEISFENTKFPDEYYLPHPLEVSVGSNTITRYSLRLVEKTQKINKNR